jgi:hypothetical protein
MLVELVVVHSVTQPPLTNLLSLFVPTSHDSFLRRSTRHSRSNFFVSFDIQATQQSVKLPEKVHELLGVISVPLDPENGWEKYYNTWQPRTGGFSKLPIQQTI